MEDAIERVLHVLADVAVLLTLCGLAAAIAGALAVRRFTRAAAQAPVRRPAVTVLRPLCGAEPMLEQALESMCRQDYPGLQIVLGVQSPLDPALLVVDRIRARFPACEIDLVCDPASHGKNRKIGNLINMLPLARHDTLVFCDSDLHVAPDYIDRIVAELDRPGTGLVTTVCAGLPVVSGLAARLGASAITHSFVPGALLSRAMGRQDCLGTTMALRRDTLAAIGGLPAMLDHLADDNMLGQLVRRLGLSIALAPTVPRTAVTEESFGALWRHEERWARTIRGLEPVLYALSAMQYPLFWAAGAAILSPGGWTLALFGAAWAVRAGAAHAVNRSIAATSGWSWALLPMRDALSVAQVANSFLGAKVIWRGQEMRAGRVKARPEALPPSAQEWDPAGDRGAQTPFTGVQPTAVG